MAATLAAAACLLAPAGARAQDRVFWTITPERRIGIMGSLGETGAETTSGPAQAVVWIISGRPCLLVLGEARDSILFYHVQPGVTAELAAVNAWNLNHRFSRSYLDPDGDAVIECDLDLAGGVGEENVREFLKTSYAIYRIWYEQVMND
jgi:hypothetical protein